MLLPLVSLFFILQPWLLIAVDLVTDAGESTESAPARPYSGTWPPIPLMKRSLPQASTGTWLPVAFTRPPSSPCRLVSLFFISQPRLLMALAEVTEPGLSRLPTTASPCAGTWPPMTLPYASLPQASIGTWLLLTLTMLGWCAPSDIVAALAIGAAKPSSPAVATVSARAWVFLSISSRSPFFAIYRQTGSGDEF